MGSLMLAAAYGDDAWTRQRLSPLRSPGHSPSHADRLDLNSSQDLFTDESSTSLSPLSAPSPLFRPCSPFYFLVDEYAPDRSPSVASPVGSRRPHPSPSTRPTHAPSAPLSSVSPPSSPPPYSAGSSSTYPDTPPPFPQPSTPASSSSSFPSSPTPSATASSFHPSPSPHQLAALNWTPSSPTAITTVSSPVPSSTNALPFFVGPPGGNLARSPLFIRSAHASPPSLSPRVHSSSPSQYPAESPSALLPSPSSTYQHISSLSIPSFWPPSLSSSTLSSSSASSPSSPFPSPPPSTSPLSPFAVLPALHQVENGPAPGPTDDTFDAAQLCPLPGFASIDLSTQIVAAYESIKLFADETSRLEKHFLYQAKMFPMVMTHLVQYVVQDAKRIIKNSRTARSRWKRNGQDQENPEKLQLWYFLENVVIRNYIRQKKAERPLPTMLMNIVAWETHHRLDSFARWNDFYLFCQHCKAFHEELLQHYRSQFGDASAMDFEHTVWGYAERQLKSHSVMTSPDEGSFRRIVCTISRVLSDHGPVLNCRRKHRLLRAAAATLPDAPPPLSSSPMRLLKPFWTLPAADTDVDRPADLQPFTEYAHTINLFARPPSFGDRAAPLQATVLCTQVSARMRSVLEAPAKRGQPGKRTRLH